MGLTERFRRRLKRNEHFRYLALSRDLPMLFVDIIYIPARRLLGKPITLNVPLTARARPISLRLHRFLELDGELSDGKPVSMPLAAKSRRGRCACARCPDGQSAGPRYVSGRHAGRARKLPASTAALRPRRSVLLARHTSEVAGFVDEKKISRVVEILSFEILCPKFQLDLIVA
jgi:hypothetical protein